MSSQPIPYPLRMPDELRDQLTERARANNRSLNAEIIAILQEAVSRREAAPTGIDLEQLADAVAARVAARLKDAEQN